MATLFTRIIEGELPGTFVWNDDTCVAFMTIAPLRTGHVLVVPRVEEDHWLDLSPEVVAHISRVAQVIGQAQMEAFEPARVGLIIAGMEVPHTHLHVVPIDSESDLDFANASPNEPDQLEAAATKIRAALEAMGREEVSS